MNIGEVVTTVSLIIIFIFLFLIVLFFQKAKKIKSAVAVKKEDKKGLNFEEFREDWQAVLSHLNSNNESDWKLAIIEADKIVDEILVLKGYKGESMAERMTSIDRKELKSLQLLWEAHKIRNRIAHQTGFRLDFNQAQKAISYYEEVLKDLKTLS